MRSIVFASLLFILPVLHSTAQATSVSVSPVFIYGDISGGLGTGESFKAGIDALFSGNNIITISYHYFSKKAPGTPSDFSPGLTIFTDGYPYIRMNTVSFMYGRMLFGNTPKVRYSLKGGIALGHIAIPGYFHYANSNGIFYLGANYDWRDLYNPVAGLVLNPSVELPFSRGFGFAAGISSIINPYRTTLQLELSLIFGRLRKK